MADKLPSEVQNALKLVAGTILQSGLSFSTIVGEDNRLCIVLAYPVCCMPHAEDDLRTFRDMLVMRGIADPAAMPQDVEDSSGRTIPNLFKPQWNPQTSTDKPN